MNCRGVRGRSKAKSVRFSSDFPSAASNKPSKDHGTSSYDSKQDSDRRSTGSGRKEVNPIKCRFYKSPGDESTVERREFEIWNGSLHKVLSVHFPGVFSVVYEKRDMNRIGGL